MPLLQPAPLLLLPVVNNYPVTKTGWYSHDICLNAGCDNNVTASIEIERIADCPTACGCKK